MGEVIHMSQGIEVTEQALNRAEAGFLSGVCEAWANRTMTEADFRGAMEMVMAKSRELDS